MLILAGVPRKPGVARDDVLGFNEAVVGVTVSPASGPRNVRVLQ